MLPSPTTPYLLPLSSKKHLLTSVNEGPFVVKRDGIYYMTYSANSYESPSYGVGLATAVSLTGQWEKSADNPILQFAGSLEGVGHHALFKDADGKDRIVFHSHNSPGKIHPRIIHIGKIDFKKGTMKVSKKFMTPEMSMAQEQPIFPEFPQPADTLDAIYYDSKELSGSEVVMLATLQAQVNSIQPRIYLMKHKHGGRKEWADRIGINTNILRTSEFYYLVGKYSKEVSGLVVYSTEKSSHYRNLACTIAGLKGAIAVTPDEVSKLKENGIKLKTICDITDLPYTTPEEIYSHLYKKY